MLLLSDIRDYLKTRIKSNNWYVGKFNSKEEDLICLLDIPTTSLAIPVGGIKNKTYNEKNISMIIQAGINYKYAETKAYEIFDKLVELTSEQIIIKNKQVKKIDFNNSNPISIGQNTYGIYQFVINLNFIYER